MTDEMTSVERWAHFYGDGKIDRVPVLSFATMYAGRRKGLTSNEYYFDVEKGYQAQKEFILEEGFDDSPCLDIPHAEMLDFGGEVGFSLDNRVELPWVKKYPIQSEQDAENYMLPPMEKRLYTKKRIEFYDYAKSLGQTGVGIGLGSPFTLVGYLVETSLFMKWLVKRPDLVFRLLKIMEEYLTQTADVLIERYGVENCSASANVPFESNDLISAKMFEKYSLPGLVHMYQMARKKGISNCNLHICGRHMKTLHFFKELKLNNRSFISIDELNDIEKVADVLGDGNVIAGNVSCKLLVSGNSEAVYRESANLIDRMKYHDGGFVLMPSCDLPIDTKFENLKAMIQAARDKSFN
jgi:uroporphyrinogen decarboxylase